MKRLIVKNIGLLAGIGHERKLCLKGKEMTELKHAVRCLPYYRGWTFC